jgi:hypothetical protein
MRRFEIAVAKSPTVFIGTPRKLAVLSSPLGTESAGGIYRGLREVRIRHRTGYCIVCGLYSPLRAK